MEWCKCKHAINQEYKHFRAIKCIQTSIVSRVTGSICLNIQMQTSGFVRSLNSFDDLLWQLKWLANQS
jgi:hypothetical protein